MSFKVTVLGSGSALPSTYKHHSAHVLNVREQFYLVDCGEGAQRQLIKAGVNPLKVNHIFITHLHGDHLYGLMPLIATMSMMGRETPLYIYAPRGLEAILDSFGVLCGDKPSYEIVFTPLDTTAHSMIYQNKVMEVWTVPLRHSVSCCGFMFREKTPPLNIHKHKIEQYGLSLAQIAAAKRGEDIFVNSGECVKNGELTYIPFAPKSYAYLSDTQYSAKAAELVKGVDLLYHEATFAEEDKKFAAKCGHSTAAQAAKVALKAEAKRLIIGHFSPRYKDEQLLLTEARELFSNTFEAKELTTFDI